MKKAKRKRKWPGGRKHIARGFAPEINGSLALTFPFARGNARAAREALMDAMRAAGCSDSWGTLRRAGWRIVPVTIRAST